LTVFLIDHDDIHGRVIDLGDGQRKVGARKVPLDGLVFLGCGLLPTLRRRTNVRKLVTGQYLILYRIVQTAKVVEILRFWHGARGTPRL